MSRFLRKFSHQALSLVEALLQNTPATTTLFTKRLAMEAVLTALRSYMFEEIVPRAVIDKRTTSQTQYFVDWFDGELKSHKQHLYSLFSDKGYDPIWVDEADIADDLIEEFEGGVERASVSKIIRTENPSSAVEYSTLSLVQVILSPSFSTRTKHSITLSGQTALCYRGVCTSPI
jgi:hypothetical protein